MRIIEDEYDGAPLVRIRGEDGSVNYPRKRGKEQSQGRGPALCAVGTMPRHRIPSGCADVAACPFALSVVDDLLLVWTSTLMQIIC